MRRNFQRVHDEQRQQIEALQLQVERLQQRELPPTDVPPPTPAPSPAQPSDRPPVAQQEAWSPTSPLSLFGGQRNYLNLSLDGLIAAGTSTADDVEQLQLGGHDPRQRGFTLQKSKSRGRIDAAIALALAIDEAQHHEPVAESLIAWR